MHRSRDMTDEQAVAFLAALAVHCPRGMDMGRPVAMTVDGTLLLDAGEPSLLSFSPDGSAVWRIIDLGDGLNEMTKFRDGAEISREIVHGNLMEGVNDE